MSNIPQLPLPPHEWHGAEQAPPLVLITGLGGKGTSWRPFLQTAERHFRVLTFDNRGAGHAAPIEGETSIRALADDALRLLDELGIERAAVMGRSMGGMIAQELALAAPERVERLVLVSTTGSCDAHTRMLFEHWARMAELGVPTDVRFRSSLLWCMGPDALADPELIAPYLSVRNAGDRPADYAAQARACARHDALGRLHALDIPALVVGGSADRLTPPEHAEALAKAIPGARLALVSGAGHAAYLEKPREFDRIVLPFLGTGAGRHTERGGSDEPGV